MPLLQGQQGEQIQQLDLSVLSENLLDYRTICSYSFMVLAASSIKKLNLASNFAL